jgi:DNA-binding CsgD family transcriptional regulator
VVGREAELTEVDGFLRAGSTGFAGLVLEGEAGIGKTTLWQEALDRGARRGALVLRCRPAAAEAKLSFAALADLLDGLEESAFGALPEPQRQALAVALLRAPASDGAPIARAVAAGFLSLLRSLASAQPVLVAVDDWQWLDAASRRVLEFAARRLEAEAVGLLCSLRRPAAGPGPTAASAGQARWRRLVVEPLSLAAIGRIVSERLELAVPRPLLVRVRNASNGNPFYALEIARLIATQSAEVAERYVLPVPEDLRKLTSERIRRLPGPAREALLLASVLADPHGGILDLEALGPAEADGIVAIDSAGRIRFAHPLFASAVSSSIPLSRRRELHRLAAALVSDREQRARHLALGCEQADAAVAAQLDEAAWLAASRGAPDVAAELAELAAQLTPTEDGRAGASASRLLMAARFQFDSGDLTCAERLASDLASQAPVDALRAEALQLLSQLNGRRSNFGAAEQLARQALELAGGDAGRRASIELEVTYCAAGGGNIPAALEHARRALQCAQEAGAEETQACALACLTMVRFFTGQGLDEDQLARALALEDPVGAPMVIRPRYVEGVLSLWVGDLEGSLQRLGALLEEAVVLGQEAAVPMLLLYMVQARLAQGEFEEAARLVGMAQEGALMLDDPTASAVALGAAALFHAHEGDASAGRRSAREALELFEALQWRAGAIWPIWALGLIELAAGHPEQVDQWLAPLYDQLLAIGSGDPSFFVFVPDEVEALVRLGELERARAYLEPFARQARARYRSWAVAVAERCHGLLLAARGEAGPALAALERALAAHELTEMAFDRARTLLIAGQTHRRFKQRRRAGELLAEAQEAFEQIGARAWAEMAAEELARVGHRASDPGALTETERRLAELAASGLSNQEVAERAFVSVKTVEANLTRVYRKLGVRSRVGLVGALGLTGNPHA